MLRAHPSQKHSVARFPIAGECTLGTEFPIAGECMLGTAFGPAVSSALQATTFSGLRRECIDCLPPIDSPLRRTEQCPHPAMLGALRDGRSTGRRIEPPLGSGHHCDGGRGSAARLQSTIPELLVQSRSASRTLRGRYDTFWSDRHGCAVLRDC